MGRAPCCVKDGLKKGPWLPEEDQKLIDHIQKHGPANWKTLPKKAGLQRCGKSCRLRWTNYLRPDIKRGRFSFEEEEAIIQLHSILGNKWSAIAAKLPGRTDNEIKNYWNTHIRKRLLRMGIDPVTHTRRLDLIDHLSFPYLNNPSNDQLNLLMNFLSLQTLMNPDNILSLATLLSTTQDNKLPFLLNSNNSTTIDNSNQMQNQFNPIWQTQHNACSGSKPTFDQYPTHIPTFDMQNCTNKMENNEGLLAQVCTNNSGDLQRNQNLDFGNNQVLMEKLMDYNSNDQSLFLPWLLSTPSSSQQQTYPNSSSCSEEDEIDSYCQKLMNFDIPLEFFDGCKS